MFKIKQKHVLTINDSFFIIYFPLYTSTRSGVVTNKVFTNKVLYLRRMLIMSAKMCYLSKDEAEMLLMKYSNEERDMLMTIVNGYQGKDRVDLCERPHYGTPIDDKLWGALMAPEENTDAIAKVEENVEAGDEADLCPENDDTNIDFENEDFLLDGLVEYI